MTLSIILIAVVLHVIGFIWYSKGLFGNAWMRVMGAHLDTPETAHERRKGMGGVILTNLVLSAITIATLSWALGGESNVATAMKLSFVIWFGFAMPMQAGAALWSGKPRGLAWTMFLVSAGYQLVAFLVAGVLLAVWQ